MLLAVAILCALTLTGAARQPLPRFEVASIRQNVSGFGSISFNIKGQTLTTVNYSLVGLMQFAYEITAEQIVGGPDWVRNDRFDVVAKIAADAKEDQTAHMLRALLEERFKLRLRNEKREMAILELALANSDGRVGPNLYYCSKNVSTPERTFAAPRGGNVAAGSCGPVSNLARLAAGQVQGIVRDKTGLTGKWRFNIYFGPDLPDANSVNPDLPSFVTALREQLGLKLERARGLVDVVVIDSVERPTPD
jgi:uncharacterized protein (TIGR03435 family)